MYYEKQKAVSINVHVYILVRLADPRCLAVSEAAVLSEVGHVPMQQRLDEARAIPHSLPRTHDSATWMPRSPAKAVLKQ